MLEKRSGGSVTSQSGEGEFTAVQLAVLRALGMDESRVRFARYLVKRK